jgi:hypothetical protein
MTAERVVMRNLIPAVLFMMSSGIYFNDEVKRNRVAVGFAGFLAIIASVFTLLQTWEIVTSYFNGTRTLWAELAAICVLLGSTIVALLAGLPVGRFVSKSQVVQKIRDRHRVQEDVKSATALDNNGRVRQDTSTQNVLPVEIHHHYHYHENRRAEASEKRQSRNEIGEASRVERHEQTLRGTSSRADVRSLPSKGKTAEERRKAHGMWFRAYYTDEKPKPTSDTMNLLGHIVIIAVAIVVFWLLVPNGLTKEDQPVSNLLHIISNLLHIIGIGLSISVGAVVAYSFVRTIDHIAKRP